MVMYTCMIPVPPMIFHSVLKNMQKLRLVASLGTIMYIKIYKHQVLLIYFNEYKYTLITKMEI